MATIYYGKGDCSITGAVVGIQMRYKGAVKITKTSGENSLLVANNNKIIIVSLNMSELNDLFKYKGEITITSIVASDINGERVPTTIKSVMDYPELTHTKSEDMTINSEKMTAAHIYGSKVNSTTVDVKILENQTSDGTLYYKDGTPYSSGSLYHIHLNSGQAMTGGEHTKDSENLYIKKKKDDTLVLTGITKSTTTRSSAIRSRSTKSSSGRAGGRGY